jgi:hypothetical protein
MHLEFTFTKIRKNKRQTDASSQQEKVLCLFCSIENRKINKEAFDLLMKSTMRLFETIRYSDWNTSKND